MTVRKSEIEVGKQYEVSCKEDTVAMLGDLLGFASRIGMFSDPKTVGFQRTVGAMLIDCNMTSTEAKRVLRDIPDEQLKHVAEGVAFRVYKED